MIVLYSWLVLSVIAFIFTVVEFGITSKKQFIVSIVISLMVVPYTFACIAQIFASVLKNDKINKCFDKVIEKIYYFGVWVENKIEGGK